MELEQLKSDWKNINTPEKEVPQLKMMLSENKHPVLKDIRRQLTIELFGSSAFLLCYYTMFDGHEKPLMINLLLVASIMASLVHNVSGYNLSKNLLKEGSLVVSLQYYLVKMKKYAFLSVLSRAVFTSGLLAFFCYNISFTPVKYYLLAGCISLIPIQIIILSFIWSKRIRVLKSSIDDLTGK
jgi:hypothetical protein